MRRREFLVLGGAAAWPMVARAQQTIPLVGVISLLSPETMRQPITAFLDGLREVGYHEGQNVAVEYRFAEGQYERIPAFVADLVRRRAAMLVGATQVAQIAKRETATVPIVFNTGGDPVRLGLVASFNRPGGNLTGVVQFTQGLEAKRLGLLHEIVPKVDLIAALVDPNFVSAEAQVRDVQEAAGRLGMQHVILRAGTENEIDEAFATLVQRRAGALLVCSAPFFYNRHQQLVRLAARHAVPTIYERRDFAAAGGLMSYGTNLSDAYRQMGVYAGRILGGVRPADLPVVQLTKFEFVINLKIAKALGLTVPPTMLARADEAIE
jgi:putative tryptophan/tyrosine transport system substrate-binding protein